MNTILNTVFWVLVYWFLLVSIAYLLGRKLKGIEVSPLYIVYKKGVMLESLERRVKQRRWFRAYLLSSVPALIVSAVLFYYIVGSIALTRVSGGPSAGGLVPIIPGVTLRGSTLVYVLIIIGLSATLHELSHAAAALHEGVRVRSTGFFIFFFIPAAFVEPVEEEFQSKTFTQKARILSAGPASNLYAGLAFFLILLAITHGITGAEIIGVEPGSPAEKAGLKPGMIILYINDTPIQSIGDVGGAIKPHAREHVHFNFTVRVPGDGVEYIIVEKPSNRSLVGITIRTPKAISFIPDSLYYPLFQFITYGYIINVSLALINSAPLFISDGGRILSLAIERKWRGPGGKAFNFFLQITTVLLVLFSLSLAPLR